MVLSYEFFYIHIKKTQFILHLLEKKTSKTSKTSSPLMRIFKGNRIVLNRSIGENNTDK